MTYIHIVAGIFVHWCMLNTWRVLLDTQFMPVIFCGHICNAYPIFFVQYMAYVQLGVRHVVAGTCVAILYEVNVAVIVFLVHICKNFGSLWEFCMRVVWSKYAMWWAYLFSDMLMIWNIIYEVYIYRFLVMWLMVVISYV